MSIQEQALPGMSEFEAWVREFKQNLSDSLDTKEMEPLMRKETARALVRQFEIDMKYAKVSAYYYVHLGVYSLLNPERAPI